MLKRLTAACVLALAMAAVVSATSDPNSIICIPWLGCGECPFYICL